MRQYFNFALLLAVAWYCFSCGRKEERKSDSSTPLPYEMKTFRVESAGACTADTAFCASYEVIYPRFEQLTPAANDSLARRISEAADTGNPEQDTVSFELAGKNFIASFEESKKEMPDLNMGWYYKATLSVNIAADTLISIRADTEFFTGGAHGGYGTTFINVNPATGRRIALADIFKPGFEEVLRREGEADFRKSQELADTASYVNAGFEFQDDKFVLNDNYGFTKDGIVFVFNIYEIAPYALGAQEVHIPYARLKEWMKKE
jgi:hypothetical protein